MQEELKKNNTRTLIVFGKLPVKGLVKTRLIGEYLTENDVTTLYEAFLSDTLSMALKSNCDNIFWFYYPDNPDAAQDFLEQRGFAKQKKIEIKKQLGSDFGERFTAVLHSFIASSPQNLVIIGTDLPQLQPNAINRAFGLLETAPSLVLGPSRVGGFYLLGLPNSIEIESRTFFDTKLEVLNYLEYAKSKKLPLYLLDEMSDVDIFSDLISLYCHLQLLRYASRFENYFFPINTYNQLLKLDLRKSFNSMK